MIPIRVSPFFWVTAALIGFLNSRTLYDIFIWIGIVFVSVLFHEMGHAFTAMAFRQKTSIQLVAFGGLTSYEGPKLKFWQQFLIVLNGPLFGILLCVGATLLLHFQWPPMATYILKLTQVANLFWSIVNLFPVQPLDGGQLMRIALEAWFGVKGFRASFMVGAVLSVLVALGFFVIQAYLIGALFFLFAFQSYDLWRKTKSTKLEDRDEGMSRKIAQAEGLLAEGKRQEAEQAFSEVMEHTKEGMLHTEAIQKVALLKWLAGQKEEAYHLLLPIEKELSEDAKVALHALAAEYKNWALVAKLSAEVYQIAPSPEMALDNARAFAHLGEAKPAGGWLLTASSEGALHLEKVLQEAPFQAIKNKTEFQHFMKNLP